MSETTEKKSRKGISPNLLIGAGALTIIVGMVSGTYLGKTIYEPQVAIVAELEEQADAPPRHSVEYYEDFRAERFHQDAFFESETWSEYMKIANRTAEEKKAKELEVFDAKADGVWIPGLNDRIEEAREEISEREENDEFMHMMLASTATTLACDASGHDHSHGVDGHSGQSIEEHLEELSKGHSNEEIAEDRIATQKFVETWSIDGEPMKYVIEPYLPELSEEDKKVVHKTFTEAMKSGLPYYCPMSA